MTRLGRMMKWHSIFVLISSCLTMVLHVGLLNAIGTFFTDVMTTFNSSRAETAVIQSSAIGVFLCLGIFTGALITKFGLTVVGMLGSFIVSVGLMACFFASSLTYLIISIGVVSGLGVFCVYISSVTAISQYFSGKKQSFYLSIHATGPGVGGMIYPYFIRYLSDVYGFRGALLLIGAICMNTVPACILWKRHNNTIKRQNGTEFTNQIDEFQTRFKEKTEGSGDIILIEKLKETASAETSDSVYVSQYPVVHDEMKTKTVIVQAARENLADSNKSKASKNIKQTLSNKVFMTFVIGLTIVFPSVLLIVIFVADIYQDNGLSSDDVSLGLFLVNVTSIIGRLLPGILLQSKRVSPLILPLINAVFTAVLIFVFVLVESRWFLIVLTCAVGIPMGIVSSMITVVTLKLVGSDTLPTALGICFTLIGIGQVVSGPVNGYIRDVTGSYTAIFYAAAGVNLVAVVLFFVAYIMRRKETQNIKKRSSVFYLTSF
ncbi:monocarboxylate transporter 13-like isoform X2 [Mercenaria mercenaria]|uniref:monocarboxylate transporter 13-like isoform X2 n=1 Tax=Mercenaria mercenaria TaxID=6596 RepID=UPI00234F251B|nr:monocarboxylate transporter 13-like isoform X2 [Mercenaria mercenaria]